MGTFYYEIFDAIGSFLSMIGAGGIWLIVLAVIGGILSVVKEIAKLFLACSVAHVKKLGRPRVLIGIVSYFIFSWLEVLIVQAFMFMTPLFPSVERFVQRLDEMNQLNMMSSIGDFYNFTDILNGVMVIGIAYSLILVVVYAMGTVRILNRRLDL